MHACYLQLCVTYLEDLRLPHFDVQGAAPDLADVHPQLPVHPGALDADQDPEVERGPVGVGGPTVRTEAVAGHAPQSLQWGDDGGGGGAWEEVESGGCVRVAHG